MSNVFVFRQPPAGFINEYFGGGKGGSTTTTNNVTQIPPEVLARYNAVNARAETVAQQPYQAYSNDPNAFVAPLNATQQAGIQNTNIMAGAAQPYYGAATNQLMQAQAGAQPGMNAAYQNVGQAQQLGQGYLGAATGVGLAGAQGVNPGALNINQYMNPFTQNVVNATQAAMNQQQGQQLSQQQSEAIRAGAFGGERAGLQRGALMGQQALAQAQAIAPLYQQNYQQALAAAQQQQGVGLGAEQANRAAIQNYGQQLGNLGQQGYQQGMGAAQQYGALSQQGYNQGAGTSAALAGLGTNAQQAGLAGAQAQLAAGQTQQQTQQAGLQALYNQFQQQQGFPYQQAQFLANIAEGTGALSGNATSGTSTTTGGGGFFSDERLKENIQRVGETDDGQPIYRYNYKGDKNTQIGLLAQDVEKHHPEAVGLAGGYKTVNYKKATEDAVHKADGGAAGDAYSMGAPSQMLQENSGKGLGAVPTLPQMITGPQRIEAGANAADVAAMRAPTATGFAPGVREGKQAELASLQSTLANPGPNANQLGSGPDYLQNRIGTLQDWLSKNNSQGGLVSGPGNFARGGLADGGYMNPALAYYSPQQGQQGVFQLQPVGQHQILRGEQMQVPQKAAQPDAIASANQAANLAVTGSKIYDWAKKKADAYNNDYIPGGENRDAVIDLNTDPDVVPIADLARGGVAGNRHHYSLGGGNPYGLGGGNDFLGDTIKDQDVSRRIQGDKATPPPQPKQQQSGGLGSLAQMASLGKTGKDAYGWAAKQLAGEASPTAMSATSTEAVPGLAGAAETPAAAAEATGIAGAAPEALSAGLAGAGETAAGLAGAGETAAGLAGGAEAAAAAAEAASAASAMDFLPFLFLKDGGVVPRQHHATTGSVPVNIPEQVPEGASSRFGTDVGQPMTDEEKANALIKTLAGQTIAEKAPVMDRRPIAPAAAEAPARAPSARPALSEIPVARTPFQHFASKVLPEDMNADTKSALTSENLWVPALAGVGAMLASPNKTLAGAIGSGLVGGTTAYTGLQKQQADVAKTEAESRGLDVLNYQRSIQSLPDGTNVAWLANGDIMLLGDYDKLQREGKNPPLLGRIPDNADVRLQKWLAERAKAKPPEPAATIKAAPPANAAPAPVTVAASAPAVAPKTAASAVPEAASTKPPAAATPEPKKVQVDYDDKSKELAESERSVGLSGGTGSATAKDVTKRYIAAVAPSATAARDSQRYLSELASNLADATKGKGLDVPGFGFSGRAQFTGALNTLSRAFGGEGSFGQGDSIDQINKKIESLQASISAAGGGQESYSALNMLRQAMANPNMSPRAYSQLSGDLLATNQRAIDRDTHMSKYAKDSQGMLQNAAQDFERTHDSAMYKRESDAIAKMILQQPELIKDLRSGKYTSQQIDDAFAKQGLRNMSRYFVGRT